MTGPTDHVSHNVEKDINLKAPDTSSVEHPGAFLGTIMRGVRETAAGRLNSRQRGLTLDVGCGNGLFFASLPESEGGLVGIDRTSGLLQEARRVFSDNQVENVWLAISDALMLPFEDQTFDNIFFLNTLMNISDDTTVHEFLCEFMRVCRPGGRIFLDFRNAANPYFRVRYWLHNLRGDFTIRAYHLSQIRGVFAAGGFEIIGKWPVGPLLPFGRSAYLLEVRRPA